MMHQIYSTLLMVDAQMALHNVVPQGPTVPWDTGWCIIYQNYTLALYCIKTKKKEF